MAAPPLHQPARDASLGPATRPDAWRWLLTALLCVAGGEVLALVLASLGAAFTGVHGGVQALANASSPPVWFLVASFAGLWGGFGAAGWLVTRHGRAIGLRLAPGDSLYVFLGMALQLAVNLVLSAVSPHQLTKTDHKLLPGAGWAILLPAILTIVGAPIFEELFFRGVLLRGLLGVLRKTRVGVAVAVAVDAVLFAVLHVGTDPWVAVPELAAVGVVLAVLALRTRRLGPSIVTHASFNALTVAYFVWTR